MATLASAPADAELRNSLSRGRRIWRWTAASSAVAAGGLHLAAGVEYVGAHDLVVGFFLMVAFAQLGLGAWIVVSTWAGVQPDVRLVALALLGTVGLVGLYLVAHTTDLLAGFQVHEAAGAHHGGTAGVPQGHSTETAGPVALNLEPVTSREPAGPLGTATVAVEMVTVLALTALLPGRWKSGAANALFLLGGVTWVLWLAGVLG
jgi:hypothetical protein